MTSIPAASKARATIPDRTVPVVAMRPIAFGDRLHLLDGHEGFIDQAEKGEGRAGRDSWVEIMGRDAGHDGEIRARPLERAEPAQERGDRAGAAVKDGLGPVRDLGQTVDDDRGMVLVALRRGLADDPFEEIGPGLRPHAAEDADRLELFPAHLRRSLTLSRGRGSATCPSLPSIRTALNRELRMASSAASAAAWKSGETASSRSSVTVRVGPADDGGRGRLRRSRRRWRNRRCRSRSIRRCGRCRGGRAWPGVRGCGRRAGRRWPRRSCRSRRRTGSPAAADAARARHPSDRRERRGWSGRRRSSSGRGRRP